MTTTTRFFKSHGNKAYPRCINLLLRVSPNHGYNRRPHVPRYLGYVWIHARDSYDTAHNGTNHGPTYRESSCITSVSRVSIASRKYHVKYLESHHHRITNPSQPPPADTGPALDTRAEETKRGYDCIKVYHEISGTPYQMSIRRQKDVVSERISKITKESRTKYRSVIRA